MNTKKIQNRSRLSYTQVAVLFSLTQITQIFLYFQRNTYQAVILTDGSETYTILNYYDVNWMGSVNEGCASSTGTGPVDTCFPAQVS